MRPFTLSGILLIGLAACGGAGHSDAGADSGASLTALEACEGLASARCAVLSRCFAAFNRNPPDLCGSIEQARCLQEYGALAPSFDAGAAVIDSAHVLECESRMNSSDCPPTFPPDYAGGAVAPFADCEWTTGLSRGLVDAGGLCSRPIDCGAGTRCIQSPGACKGTCGALAAANQPCGFGCASGLYCETFGTPDTSDDRCLPLKGVGVSCASSLECQPDLSCAGSCQAPGGLGDPCRFDPDRLSTCAPGLACDVVPFTTQIGTCVVPGKIRDACRFHWSCAPGLACHALDFAGFPQTLPQAGVCGPPSPVGAACPFSAWGSYFGSDCGAGSLCGAQGQCVTQPVLGDACIPSAQSCAGVNVWCKPGGTGDTGTCATPPGLNQRCAFQIAPQDVIQIPCGTGYCESQNTLTCQAASLQNGELCLQDAECLSGRCAVQPDSSQRCAAACL